MSTISSAQLEELSKKVIAKAAKSKFILTPEAYRVWFEYFAAGNKDLISDMEAIIESGVAFSPNTHESLYKKYFSTQDGDETEVMDQVHRETQEMIKGIFDGLLTANKNTADFGGRLGKYSEKLKEVDDLRDIQKIMKAMINDTTKMTASTNDLQQKLKQATLQSEQLKEKLKETEKEAFIDGLTQLNNRKSFDKKIEELFKEYKTSHRCFSVVFVDIDFFKKFNDTYGHKVGDLVLQTVGKILHKGVKGGDFPARYGGEEFIILFPGTMLEHAKIVAEQLRVLISVKKPKNPETGEVYNKITASLGVAQIKPGDTAESVVDRADKALYLAKESGRNNVKTEMELPE